MNIIDATMIANTQVTTSTVAEGSVASITLWKPETDIVLHQALGKVAEEANELAGMAARCLIQGFCESHPVTGIHNHVALREEIADMLAAIDWLVGLNPDLIDSRNSTRYHRKLAGFRKWQEMLVRDEDRQRTIAEIMRDDPDLTRVDAEHLYDSVDREIADQMAGEG